jgi:hypothetical protein
VRLKEHAERETAALVLGGVEEPRIMEREHDKLSTWGLLSGDGIGRIRDWIG